MKKLAVVAIGGNSLIKDDSKKTVADQYQAICETCAHIADMVECGYDVVVTHGNGPQVGFLARRSEVAFLSEGLHPLPLVTCVADTQGGLGYQIQQALGNEFKRRGIDKRPITIVTQCLVDSADPAFKKPSKPIGSFYNEEQYKKVAAENPDWTMVSDAGRGYRRVVASPRPKKIIETEAIDRLVREGYSVIAVGGGGVPVVEDKAGNLVGMDAVIDKDFASSLLATKIGADILIISTGVPEACVHFGKPEQKALREVSVAEIKKYAEEGHFAPGSMLPKVQAAIEFIERGGKCAIITNPESLAKAVRGESGTHIK